MKAGLGDVNHWFRLGLSGIPVIVRHQSKRGMCSVAPQVTPCLLGGERLALWNQSCSWQEECTTVILYFQGHSHALGLPSLMFCTGDRMAHGLLT